MIFPRLLFPIVLAIAVGSAPLLAQPAPETNPAEPASQAPEKTAPAQPAPTTPKPAPTSTPPTKGKDSPFDYQPSEEISEDLPVSFPVDI